MRQSRNVTSWAIGILAAATLLGCNSTSSTTQTEGVNGELSLQSSERVYLSQLKSADDLVYYGDLRDEFVLACSDKDMRKGNGKDKKKKDDHSHEASAPPKHAGLCAIICHVPPGNPSKQKTLIIGLAAVEAHLSHGPGEVSDDYLGPCGDRSEDDDGEGSDDGGADDGSNEEVPDDTDGSSGGGSDDGSNEEVPDDTDGSSGGGSDDGSNEEVPDDTDGSSGGGSDDGSNEEVPDDTGAGDGDNSSQGDGSGGTSPDDPPADPDL